MVGLANSSTSWFHSTHVCGARSYWPYSALRLVNKLVIEIDRRKITMDSDLLVIEYNEDNEDILVDILKKLMEVNIETHVISDKVEYVSFVKIVKEFSMCDGIATVNFSPGVLDLIGRIRTEKELLEKARQYVTH